jgi:hypothetical protein
MMMMMMRMRMMRMMMRGLMMGMMRPPAMARLAGAGAAGGRLLRRHGPRAAGGVV